MRRTVLFLTMMVLVHATPGLTQTALSNLYDFGSIGLEAPVEHTFDFQNDRSELLEIAKVQLSPPLIVTRMTSRVKPGENGSVAVRLETPREKGDFKGLVAVNFKNPGLKPLFFWVVVRLAAPMVAVESLGLKRLGSVLGISGIFGTIGAAIGPVASR